jgi:nucleotide-diphospho-sugar transferase
MVINNIKRPSLKQGDVMKIKLLLITIILVIHTTVMADNEKIKLYALYTPSHEILKDNYFLPSIQDDFDIILEEWEQTCPTAQFLSEGWTQTTMRKVDLIIRAIHENWGSFFIFSDVDIQFFRPIKKTIISLIKNYDLIIQKNNPEGVLCSGFFACRGNEKTLQLWTDVKKRMQETSNSDQISLNQCIKRNSKNNPYDIAWNYLPDTFFGGGTLTGYLWYPGTKLPIPNGIMMHHANWTQGIKNKIAQLEYVKKHVLKKKNVSKD